MLTASFGERSAASHNERMLLREFAANLAQHIDQFIVRIAGAHDEFSVRSGTFDAINRLGGVLAELLIPFTRRSIFFPHALPQSPAVCGLG